MYLNETENFQLLNRFSDFAGVLDEELLSFGLSGQLNAGGGNVDLSLSSLGKVAEDWNAVSFQLANHTFGDARIAYVNTGVYSGNATAKKTAMDIFNGDKELVFGSDKVADKGHLGHADWDGKTIHLNADAVKFDEKTGLMSDDTLGKFTSVMAKEGFLLDWNNKHGNTKEGELAKLASKDPKKMMEVLADRFTREKLSYQVTENVMNDLSKNLGIDVSDEEFKQAVALSAEGRFSEAGTSWVTGNDMYFPESIEDAYSIMPVGGDGTKRSPKLKVVSYVPTGGVLNGAGSILYGLASKWFSTENWPTGHGAVGLYKHKEGYNFLGKYNSYIDDDYVFANDTAQFSYEKEISWANYNNAKHEMELASEKNIFEGYAFFSSNCINFSVDRIAISAGVDNIPHPLIASPQALADWMIMQENGRLHSTSIGYSSQGGVEVEYKHDLFRFKNDYSVYFQATWKSQDDKSSNEKTDDRLLSGIGVEFKNFGWIPNFYTDVSYSNNANRNDTITWKAGIDFFKIDNFLEFRAGVSTDYNFRNKKWAKAKFDLGVYLQL